LCGIAGIIGPSAPDRAVLDAMAGCLRHRGPDDGATWSEGPVGLAHRRLAVLGLGAAGAQPMHSASGRYVVIYNGELYNHRELRRVLDGTGQAPPWRGASDTETLLAGIEAWGLDGFLPRTVGMFAFALWDRSDRRLTLVRDRMGEKPLSWAPHAGGIVFASQPSALRQVPGFAPSIDREALAELLRHAYVPGGRTIHHEIRALPPGALLEVTVGQDGLLVEAPRQRTWWSFTATAAASLEQPLEGDDRSLTATVGEAITASVRDQLLAEVPVGAFLSGGIDSSLVVATMQTLLDRPARTFTIGFAERAYDESGHARAVAAHLGTEHTELTVTAAEAQAIIPDLPHVYDEPFADSSQIPTLLVSRLARQDVTVALSGDGGDELFDGYRRFSLAASRARFPRPLAVAAGGLLRAVGQHQRSDAARSLGRSPSETVRRLLSHNPDADRFVIGVDARAARERFDERWERTIGLGDTAARAMALETFGPLADDILHKVDRAAMAHSLETRVPLLDHRIVALAWRLPRRMRRRDGVGKWVLRELLAQHVPRPLFERPKAGFAVPIGQWLRGPLRTWAEDLLAPDAMAREGLLDVAAVRGLWSDHLAGRTDGTFSLWPILMFRSWADVHVHAAAGRSR